MPTIPSGLDDEWFNHKHYSRTLRRVLASRSSIPGGLLSNLRSSLHIRNQSHLSARLSIVARKDTLDELHCMKYLDIYQSMIAKVQDHP
jgi:hypothetical protein